LRYFGESFPNLGFLFWEKVARHPMGERLFPNFFIDNERLLYNSVDESYQYWMGITGVPVLNFKTYFGDLYIEFGIIGAFIFVVVSFILMKLFFNRKVTIYSLPILYYYFQLCVFAFAGFTKGGHTSFFQLSIVVLISLSLKYYLRIKAKGRNRLTTIPSDRYFENSVHLNP
jgi:oligosaccharide repeat unit polymerase